MHVVLTVDMRVILTIFLSSLSRSCKVKYIVPNVEAKTLSIKGLTMEEKLTELCKKFVEENQISCGETIYQCDWVIERAYEFIESVCDIVGYYDDDEEE